MADRDETLDVAVVGAGMAGLYLLHRLRELGFSARAFESGDDVGGTWYWNRYPGARCDVQSVDYSYSFDPEMDEQWEWSERYATQPEILRYLQFVADKHDLRRDVEFGTRIGSARWNEDDQRWLLRTDKGDDVVARFYVMATGCLSSPKDVDIEGTDRFGGNVYFTSRWPHEGVDFTGQRVAVIGTGSSAIQSIPLIAAEASQLTVYQRTPNFSVPAHNGPVDGERMAMLTSDRSGYRERARWSRGGVPRQDPTQSALEVSDEERQAHYEAAWQEGTIFSLMGAYTDIMVNERANDTVAEFVRGKIRGIVDDPEVATALCPTTYPIGTKRLCLDTNYYATFNLDHVDLVDLRQDPIETITETGIETAAESREFDAVVFATGFDAMTGAIVAVDIAGRDGVPLAERWADGPTTYLGLSTVGFPNYFMVTGPQSPSVLSNMSVSIEQHVEWICDTIDHMRGQGLATIEPTSTAQDGWVQHSNDVGELTLFPQANSWYMGANVPGKARVLLPYLGGVDGYRAICDEVVSADYLGFEFTTDASGGPVERRCVDGVVRAVKPDVAMMLQMMAEMGLPPIESMNPEQARAFSAAASAQRPPGPEVGEIIDGRYPAADGELEYRLYRPDTLGPQPVVLYFHGGGWVLGDARSDDPFCRDLCVNSGAMVISVDYRHAPEHRMPAAADDAWAAAQWVAAHAEQLGGRGGPFVVAGWSAGGNLAATVALRARDEGGPDICGQLLVTPVTDCDSSRASFTENGEGFVLTASLMEWFWEHYAGAGDRAAASPLRAASHSGLPPTMVATAQFDPLRDEGAAYAQALAAAGVEVEYLPGDGQIHTSMMAAGALPSGAGPRAQMARAVRGFFGP